MKIKFWTVSAIIFVPLASINMYIHFGTWWMPIDVLCIFMWMILLLDESNDN